MVCHITKEFIMGEGSVMSYRLAYSYKLKAKQLKRKKSGYGEYVKEKMAKVSNENNHIRRPFYKKCIFIIYIIDIKTNSFKMVMHVYVPLALLQNRTFCQLVNSNFFKDGRDRPL